MDDITFCLSECKQTDCFRHPSNIQDRTIPHSYADFKGTETCPEKMQLSKEDATKGTTFDCISRQAAISAIKEWGLLDGLSEGQAIEILADEEKVPSAQPEQRWIPCSERLPEER